MILDIDLVTLVVEDQDEVLKFYVQTLGLEIQRDEQCEEEGHWAEIAPRDPSENLVVLNEKTFD